MFKVLWGLRENKNEVKRSLYIEETKDCRFNRIQNCEESEKLVYK